MLALYRCDRQADALDTYQAARRALVDELGIEPGPVLRKLQRMVLDQDEALNPPSRNGAPRRGAQIGRPDLVHRTRGRARGAGAPRRLVHGPGGSGKTRLALRTASRVGDAFDDGAWLVEARAGRRSGARVAERRNGVRRSRRPGHHGTRGGARRADAVGRARGSRQLRARARVRRTQSRTSCSGAARAPRPGDEPRAAGHPGESSDRGPAAVRPRAGSRSTRRSPIRRSNCSPIAARRPRPGSRPTRRTSPRSSRSAAGWMASRWPSSLPPPGCARWRPISSPAPRRSLPGPHRRQPHGHAATPHPVRRVDWSWELLTEAERTLAERLRSSPAA